jgi:hypothetical protein
MRRREWIAAKLCPSEQLPIPHMMENVNAARFRSTCMCGAECPGLAADHFASKQHEVIRKLPESVLGAVIRAGLAIDIFDEYGKASPQAPFNIICDALRAVAAAANECKYAESFHHHFKGRVVIWATRLPSGDWCMEYVGP